MQVENKTPYRSMAIPGLDRDGREVVTLVVKGTFETNGNRRPQPAGGSDQIDITLADEYWGEPGLSPVKSESDLVPFKPATDLVLLGAAYSPNGRTVTDFDVEFAVGPHSFAARLTSRESASRVPLHWMESYEARRGWLDKGGGPTGFGFFPKNRAPRMNYAGSYDKQWQETRSPLLPEDFDERFFQAAFPGLIVPGRFRGDESVRAQGVTPEGAIHTELPGEILTARAYLRDKVLAGSPSMDTVILDAEERRLIVVWRWTLLVGGRPSRVRGFVVERAQLD